MFDIHALMKGLAEKRPVFHSEADFQFALAWHIREKTDEPVRLEWRFTEQHLPKERTKSRSKKRRRYLDLWLPRTGVAIELKYKTRAFEYKTNTTHIDLPGESFSLRDQSAQDHGRYDFLKDIARLEYLLDRRMARCGIAVLLTNDSLYEDRRPPEVIDADFSLHDGRHLPTGPTTMQWAESAGTRTTIGRTAPIAVRGPHTLRWSTFGQPGKGRSGHFRYLAVEVSRDPETAATGAKAQPVRPLSQMSQPACTIRRMSNEYQHLHEHLRSLSANVWKTTFAEVESVLGHPLPDSARAHRPWWANDRSGSHPQAEAWLDAGWETRNVSMSAETVEFHRVRAAVS